MMFKSIVTSIVVCNGLLHAMNIDPELHPACKLTHGGGVYIAQRAPSPSMRASQVLGGSVVVCVDMPNDEQQEHIEGAITVNLTDDIPIDHEHHHAIDIEELFSGSEPDYDTIGKLLTMHFNPNVRAVTNAEHTDSIRQALHELHNHDPHYLRTNVEQLLKQEGAKRFLDTPKDFRPFTDRLAARIYKHDIDVVAAKLSQKDISLAEQEACHEELIQIERSKNSCSWKASWGICGGVYLTTWVLSILINHYTSCG